MANYPQTTTTAFTSNIVLTNGGNAGIGTTAPAASLHVESSRTAATNIARFMVPGISTTGYSVDTYVGVSITSGQAAVIGYRHSTTQADRGMHITMAGDSIGSGFFQKVGGNVGIGEINPDSKLEVNGTIHATNLNGGSINLTTNVYGQIIRDPSDRKLKKNIKKISSPLDKVAKLRGVTFEWKVEAGMGKGTAYGMIAQEVEKVVPQLVSKSKDGVMGVRYTNMIGLLVEAVKEQQAQIGKLQQEVEKLRGKK